MRDPGRAAQLAHRDRSKSGVGIQRRGAWAVFRHRHSDITAAEFTGQRTGINPGILQRLPRQAHGHALLRMHHYRLAMGDAEKWWVEPRRTLQESAGIANPPPPFGLGK